MSQKAMLFLVGAGGLVILATASLELWSPRSGESGRSATAVVDPSVTATHMPVGPPDVSVPGDEATRAGGRPGESVAAPANDESAPPQPPAGPPAAEPPSSAAPSPSGLTSSTDAASPPRSHDPSRAGVPAPLRRQAAEHDRFGAAGEARASSLAALLREEAPASGIVAAGPPALELRSWEARQKSADSVGSPGELDREGYAHLPESPFLSAARNPLSTFSIDVDTASYANVRRFLGSGRLPPPDAVRIEELVNYFRYDYPEPAGAAPFSITTEVAGCPWAPDHRLVLVGLRGRSLDLARVPPRNLTFLLDVSGSMSSPDKLPLLKSALRLLASTLREQDRVAIVVYAGAAGVVLPPTSGADREAIEAALDSLAAGGSTAGGAGIELAYRVAARSFLPGGINRVILATDGDFNVGVSSEGELVRLIEEKRDTGVFLSVLGFGHGNLQDSRMEKIADHGNGNYSYIDSASEARKVLVSEAGATLVAIAKDVKIQVEFNPARVAAYRLVGYENRALRTEDFADDRKDAGEIGAGHTVTALYEIVPAGVAVELPAVEPLRYQAPPAASVAARHDELATVKLRHKEPQGERSRLQTVVVRDAAFGAEPSGELRFVSAVAAFGMLLRGSEHRGEASWAQVRDLAEGALGADAGGYRAQFLDLVGQAEALSPDRHLAIAR